MSRTYRKYARAAGTLLDRVERTRPNYLEKIPADLAGVRQESGTCCTLARVFGSYEVGVGILERDTGRLNRWERRLCWPSAVRATLVNTLVREELRHRRSGAALDAELRDLLKTEAEG